MAAAGRSIALFLAAVILLAFSPWLTLPVAAQGTASKATAIATVASPGQATPAPTTLLDPAASGSIDINGKAYVLYDAQSGMFLLGRNPDTPLSPASITKVMTVLLALEKLKPTDVITVTREMFATIPNDYVRLGLMEGEQISVEEALYATLLISANDAAMALALTMSPSVAEFAALMNARARALGCTGTNFTNPYGLAEPTNLTTAHDMALIMAEALKHDTYTKLSTTKSHLIPATNKAGTRGLTNGNRFVSTKQYAYAPYIGGKTGFTNLSGHTIVAGARKDSRTLIGVILGATASDPRYTNLMTLFNQGFSNYVNIPLETATYNAVKAQAVAQLESRIKDSGLRLEIAGSSLDVSAFATATIARKTAGFTATLGACPTDIQPGQASQVLEYPLLIEYKDGARSRVGTLSLSLQQLPAATLATKATVAGGQPDGKSTAAEQAIASQPATGLALGTILLRIGMILLAAILVFGLVVLILMQRELKRRRERRRRPKIRRL